MGKFFKWVAAFAGIVILSGAALLLMRAVEQQWWRTFESQPAVVPVPTATSATNYFATPGGAPVALPSQVVTPATPPNAVATKQALAVEATRGVATQQAMRPEVPLNTTPQPPPLNLELEVVSPRIESGAQVTGKPPLKVELAVAIVDQPRDIQCQSTRWQWGDDTVDEGGCDSSPDSAGRTIYSATHTYKGEGLYNATFRLNLSDGSSLEAYSPAIIAGAPIPPASQEDSGWLATWLLLAGSLVAAAVAILALRRWGGRWRRAGYIAVLLLLLGMVPPLSYLPNPLGLFWIMCDCYSYDPRLPVRNAFVVAGQPEDQLRDRLNRLLGQTGLTPLDPAQPLQGYEFTSVKINRPWGSLPDTLVTTRLTYQDGSQRDYDIPVLGDNFILGAYRFTGRDRGYSNYYSTLNRLFTVHEQFPETPFAMRGGPIYLDTPERLRLHPSAQRLDTGYLGNWVLSFGGWEIDQRLAISPDGSEFLVTEKVGYGDDRRDLWLVKLDGSPPRRIAQRVIYYAWSPDGRSIVFNTGEEGFPIFSADGNGENRRKLANQGYGAPLSTTGEGVWYITNDALMIAPLDGSSARELPLPPDAALPTVVYPSPDGKRIAYGCGPAVCMQDVDGSRWTRTGTTPGEMAWSRDGSKLAVATQGLITDPYRLERDVVLNILDRDGSVVTTAAVAPNGSGGTPQWTPDGEYIFVQTVPSMGRRIIAVDTATGNSVDLTKPRWDPWFTLAPDGKYVIMMNGRGDFWRSEVMVRDRTDARIDTGR